MPDVQFTLTAQENVSQAVSRIGQSLAGLDSSNAKAFGGMVQSLANAQTASTRAATSLVQLSTAETANATAAQRLAQATAQTAQAQTQAATAAQRLAQAEAQVQAAQARAAAAVEGVSAAHARAEAAQSRAAQAALRLQQAEAQAAQGMEQMGRAAQQHGSGVSSFFSNALSAATGFLGAQVFSRIGSDIAGLGRDIVQTAGDMERTRAGFTSILGSAQAADTLIKQLQTEAARSPFQLEDFRKASQLLLGMGVAAQDVVPRLHEVSNVVAAVGGNSQSFDRISLALGQIQAKGKVQAQEINQLAESGVAGWDILARAMNKSRAEVIALGQEGKISAETFFQAFAQFANSDAISKAADKQSHTFQGLLSTIGDVGQALMTAFGTPVLQAVEPVLERIVTSLSDPQVVTTLGQWGAAAGQFAVGLINAGQTAFTVAQQIIQALSPVTDFLGQLFGIQGQAAPTITPPDFTPAAQSAAQFGGAIKSGADSAKSAKDQVADLERQTRELSRATAEANLGYDHRKQSLQDQLTLLDRQYQAENKAADISQLQDKIAKDRALAVDQYSSQGQAAAARLVDEEARLKQLQREQGHDAAKNALEDRVKAIDREKQAYDEANSARQRQLQEQMDVLRANASAAGALATALTKATQPATPPTAGLHDSRPPGATSGTPPLLQRIFGTSEQQLAAVNQFWSNLGTGLERALQGDSPSLQAGVDSWLKRIWEGGLAIFRRTGQEDPNMNITNWILPMFGIDTTKSAPEVDAQIGDWIHARILGGLNAFARTGQEDPNMNVTNWLLDALGLPRDKADQQPGPRARTGLGPADSIPSQPPPGHSEPGHYINVGGSWLWRADDPTAPRTTGPAVTDSRPPPVVTTTTRNRDSAVAAMHVTMDFNERGFNGFIDQRTNRALENAVRP